MQIFLYNFKIQPEDGSKKTKNVAESSKFIKYLIKIYVRLFYYGISLAHLYF